MVSGVAGTSLKSIQDLSALLPSPVLMTPISSVKVASNLSSSSLSTSDKSKHTLRLGWFFSTRPYPSAAFLDKNGLLRTTQISSVS